MTVISADVACVSWVAHKYHVASNRFRVKLPPASAVTVNPGLTAALTLSEANTVAPAIGAPLTESLTCPETVYAGAAAKLAEIVWSAAMLLNG